MKVVVGADKVMLFGDEGWILDGNRFLEITVARGMSMMTARSYAYDLMKFFRWAQNIKGFSFKKMTQANLQDWMLAQVKEGAKPRSINRRLVCVRVFYKFCAGVDMPRGAGVITPARYYKGTPLDRRLGLFRMKNSTTRQLKVKVPRTTIKPLIPKEVDKFMGGIHRYRDLAIVLTMLFCGLRSNEVIEMRQEDIDYENGRLQVRGKGKKERCIPVPLKLLRIYEQYNFFERPPDAESLHFFVVLQGKRRGLPMKPAGLRSLFRYQAGKIGLKMISAHKFRHLFASDLVRAGVSLAVLQKLLGHSDIQTSEIYIELLMEDIEAEYKKATKVREERYAEISAKGLT